MARRRGRNSGNNMGLYIILIGILLYILFPRLSIAKDKENELNKEGNKFSQNEGRSSTNGDDSSENESSSDSEIIVHDIIVFVVGNTQNSPAPSIINNKNIRNSLRAHFDSLSKGELPNIVIISAAGNPKTIDINKKYFLGPAANDLASESNFDDLLKGIEIALNSSPSSSGADYFAALIEAFDYVKGYDNPLVITYGSGLSDTGIFNFAFDNLISNDSNLEDKIIQKLSNDKRFSNEDYHNITLHWYGVGQTVGEQPDLKEWKKTVRRVYEIIFNYFNINYKFISIQVFATDVSVKTDYTVNITILPIIIENFKLSLNERYLTFYSDSDKLKNRSEVVELLRGVVEKLNNNKDTKIKLTGYQTVCATTKTLGVKRANTIKNILIELGISADRITTDGVAGPPDDRVEKPRCGNSGIATEHRTVILETYK